MDLKRLMMDNGQLTQLLTPISVALTDVVLLLEQSNTSSGSWCTAIDVANHFSSISANKVHQNQILFSW